MGAWHWLWAHLVELTGSGNANSKAYLFWSGFAGDLTLFGAAITFYLHHTCHTPWCPRIRTFPAADGAFRLCHKHHPELYGRRPTLELMHARHDHLKKERSPHA